MGLCEAAGRKEVFTMLGPAGTSEENLTAISFDVQADWALNRLCNFGCRYCGAGAREEHPHTGVLSPEQYLDFFNSTGKTWLLHLTGGEPFFHPHFVELCQTLTTRHYISLNTNLTSKRVDKFAAKVDPSRVEHIHCGVHVEERDRRNGWSDLLRNVAVLRDRGFPVFASLVMTPPAFERLPWVAQSFSELGVPLIPKAVRGHYERRWYPQAYTAAERAQFQNFSEQAEAVARASQWQPMRHAPSVNPLMDRKFLDGFPNFTGMRCSAGRTLVSIGVDGTIYRCGHKTVLGNVAQGRLDLLVDDRPCNDVFCAAYFCLRYSGFADNPPENYPRWQAPNRVQQTLLTIRELGRRIAK